MARKAGRKGNTVSGYFRKIFTSHPEWLHQKSNNVVLARYRKDHGLGAEEEVLQNIRNTMANVKSLMRREVRDGAPGVTAVAAKPHGVSSQRLELLEERIDECLSAAKLLDEEGLKSVIRNLRAARNEVVWKLGQD